MLKRLCLALAGLFAFVSLAQGAGTVPGFSLTPQFDLTGHVAPGCKLYIIQSGTTGTPQVSYQDTDLTIPSLGGSTLTCDAAGRLPQWFVADGTIKLRLTTSTGTQIFVGDNLLVVGPSSGGGGGGGTVDPTTIIATGDFKLVYNTGVLTGFVRCNGRTIGSATSGATERANADTSALFSFLWGADANLAVSGGRGASGAADFAANKTLTLPDCRGRTIAGLSDMGASAASWLSSTYFGTSPTTLGAVSTTTDHVTLATSNLPPYTPSGTNGQVTVTSTTSRVDIDFGTANVGAGGNTINVVGSANTVTSTGSGSIFTGTAQGGTSTPLSSIQPTILMTFYIKL